MDKAKAALNSDPTNGVGVCLAVDPANLGPEERILLLEQQMTHMQCVIMKLKKKQQGSPKPASLASDVNKDGIPVGTVCFGATEKSPFLYYLPVNPDGYVVGSTQFASLSAAAEAVSLVRRSGWTFWKLLDERTLKEAFRT